MKTDTPTPRTDEWETYCDESYYHLWRVRRKNERGFNDGYHVHNGEEARALVNLLNKQDSELAAARAEIAEWRILNGWGGTPEIINDFIKGQQTRIHLAQNLEEELDRVTEQRDRLAAALDRITMSGYGILCRQIAREALKSLTTKDHE
jgi:ATPase subunit of ABC transporter with duplicated ATPase domains